MHFLFLVVFYFSFHLILGEDEDGCKPSFVRSLSVSDELILSWTPPVDDCEISYYLIYVLSREVETVYTTEGTSMNVSFLPTCEPVTFTLIPVSTDDVEGGFHSLYLRMPVHKDANVTIDNIRITRKSEGFLLLEWELEEEWQHCTNRFRVLVYNENYNEAVDIYVETTSALLEHIMPCEDYTFGIRAIHSLIKEGPISLIRYTTPSASIAPPTLQDIDLGATTIDLTWQLEIFVHNRCSVSSMEIESSPHFKVSYPIRDDPDRPLVSTKITSLQPDTIYFLNVTVINIAGPSVPFLIAVQTLPDEDVV